MRELTKSEQVKLDIAVRQNNNEWQLFKLVWWDWFCPKKRDMFIEGIMAGKSWRFAYEDAKKG